MQKVRCGMVKVENMWACKSHKRILNAYFRIAQRVAAFMHGQTVTKCVWVAVDTVLRVQCGP